MKQAIRNIPISLRFTTGQQIFPDIRSYINTGTVRLNMWNWIHDAMLYMHKHTLIKLHLTVNTMMQEKNTWKKNSEIFETSYLIGKLHTMLLLAISCTNNIYMSSVLQAAQQKRYGVRILRERQGVRTDTWSNFRV